MTYVELHAHSAYSFLDGASLPEELAARAAELGYDALALTDHDGVCGSLEFAHACKHFGLRAITGAEVTLAGGAHVTLLCESQRGYANLCRILTDAHARTRLPGRERELLPAETAIDVVAAHAEGLVCLSGCAQHGLGVTDPNGSERLARAFPGAFYVELQRPYGRGDVRRNAAPPASPQSSVLPQSQPATCTRTTSVAHACRTRSSRSETAPCSTAPSARGAATTQRCCSRPTRCSTACHATLRRARTRSPTAARSTSRRSSATATRISPTARTRPTRSYTPSVSSALPTGTGQLAEPFARVRANGWARSWR